MQSWQSVKSELLQDPEVRKAYEASEPEAALLNAIIDYRLKRGMSQAELAEMIGVREVSISELESAQAVPSVGFLQKLTRVL